MLRNTLFAGALLMTSAASWAQSVPGTVPVAAPMAAPAASTDALSIGGRIVLGGFGRFGSPGTDFLSPTKLTFGIAAVVDKPLAENFAIGGSFEVHSWGIRSGDGGSGRDALIDLMIRPRVRSVYDDTLEFGVVVPIGGFLSVVSEDNWGESDVAPGWSFGVRPQVRVHLGDVIVDIEAGWHRRAVKHSVSGFEIDAFNNEVVLSSGVSVPL